MPACGHAVCLVRTDIDWATFPKRCKAWSCAGCARRRLAKLRAEILAGDPDMFVTLTAPPDFAGSPEECAAMMSKALNRLVKRIKRKLGTAEWPYFLVVEATKRGAPHFHICARSRYIAQQWLSRTWRELTGARIVDVRRITDTKKAAYYLASYLKKAPEQFGRMKRYRKSQGYSLREVERKERLVDVQERRQYIGITIEQHDQLMFETGALPILRDGEITHWKAPFPDWRPPLWEKASFIVATPATSVTARTHPPWRDNLVTAGRPRSHGARCSS